MMAVPLRKILKSPKFDAVVSFRKPEIASKSPSRKISSPSAPSQPSGGKSPTRKSSASINKVSKGTRSPTKGSSPQISRFSPSKEEGEVTTSSVLAVFTDKSSAASAKKTNYQALSGDSPNRADRLQVRLNALEAEMNRLKLHEEQLDHRLKRFLRQKTALVSTIDEIHLKLEGLARSHKNVSVGK